MNLWRALDVALTGLVSTGGAMVRLVSELEECGRGQRGAGAKGVFLLPRDKVMVSVSTHPHDPFTHDPLLEGLGYW